MSLAAFDVASLVVVGISGLIGARRGLIDELARLICLFIAGGATYLVVPYGSSWAKSNFGLSHNIAQIGSSVVLFIIFAFVSGFIKDMMVGSLSWIGGGTIDRTFGLFFGCIRGLMYICIFILVSHVAYAVAIPNNTDSSSAKSYLPDWIYDSVTFRAVTWGGEFLELTPKDISEPRKVGSNKKEKEKEKANEKGGKNWIQEFFISKVRAGKKHKK